MNHYIKPNWPAPNHIKACTTTRQNGYSLSNYNSFNFSQLTGDVKELVDKNIGLLKQELCIHNNPCWMKQTHSNKVIYLDSNYQYQAADACYTKEQNIICAVLTADCVPILLTDNEGTVVAAIHAGWKGLAASVVENTVKALNVTPKTLMAWIGPAIGPKAFEVGEEVRKIFVQLDSQAEQAFVSIGDNKWLMNINLITKQHLGAAKVTNIYSCEYCTFTDKDLFYSYRRDGEKTGRMASLIWISQ